MTGWALWEGPPLPPDGRAGGRDQGWRPSEGGLPTSSASPGDPLKCGEGSRGQNAEPPGTRRALTPRRGLAGHLTRSFPFGTFLGS